MGTWGTGLWSDDTTEEVRDEYLDYLRRGVESRAAVEMLFSRIIILMVTCSGLHWPNCNGIMGISQKR